MIIRCRFTNITTSKFILKGRDFNLFNFKYQNMKTVFVYFFFISLVLFVVGLISPQTISKWCKKELSRKKSAWLFGSFMVVFLIFAGVLSGNTDNKSQTIPNAPAKSVGSNSTATDKAKAKKELDDVMQLAQKAGLVTSYEFSEKANVVYIDNVWYSQTVQFKKDFLAKVATLKKAVTGYHRFEVRDAYSNEKVAEVTAFSGSLEVYK